jgi:hypothetical protein
MFSFGATVDAELCADRCLSPAESVFLHRWFPDGSTVSVADGFGSTPPSGEPPADDTKWWAPQAPPAPPERRALAKHSYPIVVVVAAALTLVATAYSFTRAPSLVRAGRALRAGQAALSRRDYVAAAGDLERVHAAAPSSHKAVVLLAEADFGAGRDNAGLQLLRGVRLSPGDWNKLTTTMPVSLQSLFGPTS